MKLLKMEKIRDGKYLKNYELTYLNKAGKEKKYEMVSRNDLTDTSGLGKKSSGISLVVLCEGKLLLLHEFRLAVNRRVYNLCAGMIEEGETLEECIRRELYEESGLELIEIVKVLPASFSAVAISDVSTNIAFVKAGGSLSDHSSDNEDILAGLYTREEVSRLIETEVFSSRAQLAAYMFANGHFS